MKDGKRENEEEKRERRNKFFWKTGGGGEKWLPPNKSVNLVMRQALLNKAAVLL